MIDMVERGASAPINKRRLRLWIRLLRATRQAESELRDFLRDDFECTLPRFDVMAALYRERDGMKMSGLSRQLLVSNGNVTGIVERLVNDGQIIRIPIEGDRRAMKVRLTPKGVSDFENMADGHEKVVDQIFSNIEHDDLDLLVKQLAKLNLRGN